MIKIYANEIKRKGIEELLQWLEESGFYQAPASSRYHLAYEGGLAEHSFNVCSMAVALNESLGKPCKRESVIIAALFHDLGKHQSFDKSFYKPKLLKSGLVASTPYERNKDLFPIPHEVASIKILKDYIDLTEQETWAILQHNGMYGDLKYNLQGNETPLQMLIHFSDMWSSRVTEI